MAYEDLNHSVKWYIVKMSSQKPLVEKAVRNSDICLQTLQQKLSII